MLAVLIALILKLLTLLAMKELLSQDASKNYVKLPVFAKEQMHQNQFLLKMLNFLKNTLSVVLDVQSHQALKSQSVPLMM